MFKLNVCSVFSPKLLKDSIPIITVRVSHLEYMRMQRMLAFSVLEGTYAILYCITKMSNLRYVSNSSTYKYYKFNLNHTFSCLLNV